MVFVIGSIISFIASYSASLLTSSILTVAATKFGPFIVKWSLKKYFPNDYNKMVYIYELSQGQSKGLALAEEILKEAHPFPEIEEAINQFNRNMNKFQRNVNNAILGATIASCLLMITVTGAKITYKIINEKAYKLINKLQVDHNVLNNNETDNNANKLVQNLDNEDFSLIPFDFDDFIDKDSKQEKINDDDNNNEETKEDENQFSDQINLFSEKFSNNSSIFNERSILTSKSINNLSISQYSQSNRGINYNEDETDDMLKSFIRIEVTERKTIPLTDLINNESTTDMFDPFLQDYYHEVNDEDLKHKLNQTVVIITPEDDNNFTETMTESINKSTVIDDNNWNEITEDNILQVDEDQLFDIESATTN